jgi:peptidoglycan/xylan/chitin deacetylase (PgdA/CDA1 family)
MFETWSPGAAPSYSVQATALRPGVVDFGGHAWSSYGGRVGVWRILRALERWGVPATFFVNAGSALTYRDAARRIVAAGHDVAGHGMYQDQLLAYQTPAEQRTTIEQCIDILDDVCGRRPTGWLSPALAFTPETAGLLAEAGLLWHADVTYIDLPHRVDTEHGPIAAVPHSDFTDNRVLKGRARDVFDVYKDTFDYLHEHEPMGLMPITLHCQFGGRPMMIAVFDELLSYLRRFDDVWFVQHAELGRLALDSPAAELSYRDRFF